MGPSSANPPGIRKHKRDFWTLDSGPGGEFQIGQRGVIVLAELAALLTAVAVILAWGVPDLEFRTRLAITLAAIHIGVLITGFIVWADRWRQQGGPYVTLSESGVLLGKKRHLELADVQSFEVFRRCWPPIDERTVYYLILRHVSGEEIRILGTERERDAVELESTINIRLHELRGSAVAPPAQAAAWARDANYGTERTPDWKLYEEPDGKLRVGRPRSILVAKIATIIAIGFALPQPFRFSSLGCAIALWCAAVAAVFAWIDHCEQRHGPYLVLDDDGAMLRNNRRVYLADIESFGAVQRYELSGDEIKTSFLVLRPKSGKEIEVLATMNDRGTVQLAATLNEKLDAIRRRIAHNAATRSPTL